MKITDVAKPKQWRVLDAGNLRRTIAISGWDFGGVGPLALLHHANGMCGAMWAQVATQLTGNYRVFAMDARGHGDAEKLRVPDDYDWGYFASDVAAVVAQLCREFDQEQVAHGIGSSFGGIVIAAAEAQTPGLFERISMFDPPIHPTVALLDQFGLTNIEIMSEREGLVAQTLKRRDVWPDRATAYDAWRQKPLFAAWQETAFQLYVDEGMRDIPSGEVQLKCSPQVEAHIFRTTGDLGPMAYAPKVAVPVTLVHAKRGFFPEAFMRCIATTFPAGEFMQLDAGHMLPFEAPAEVVKILLDRE